MRLVLAYTHLYPSYLGGLLRRAARRLGINVTTVGPRGGQWIHGTPEEPGWEPDIQVLAQQRLEDIIEVTPDTILINVDQGDGFYLVAPPGVPCAWVCTEGNPGEYERASLCNAQAVWSCMPRKPAGRMAPGLLHLGFGWDNEHTSLTSIDAHRPIDFTLHGSWSEKRQSFVDALTTDLSRECGAPLSREVWGKTLQRSKVTICDHEPGYTSGRIVDAMISGCLVLALPSAEMDMLAPRGYVQLSGKLNVDIDPKEVVELVREYRDFEKRKPILERAQRSVMHLSYDDQLLRILGSIGVHT